MNKVLPLSLLSFILLNASEIKLDSIDVESTILTEVSQKAQTSADLADALSDSVPSIDLNRRSGIANDIYIRGQKRDNISIEVDGTKVCGACPNRMDPPVSHILANQISSIEVIEGPYDVETFGVLSGGVKIKTKAPSQKTEGELNFAVGSFNYLKTGATVSGGNNTIKMLVSASLESSKQYEDGDGESLAEQVVNSDILSAEFQPTQAERKSYTKKSVMAKAYINVTDYQKLRLSYTANRSDNVLYPNSKMDAIYDYSDIYGVAYDILDISDIFKKLNVEYYYSDVDHPMGTDFRKASATMPIKTHQLQTTMQGTKLKNFLEVDDFSILVGLDSSRRTWDGSYYSGGALVLKPTLTTKSIDNSLTKNIALFTKIQRDYGDFSFSLGGRYDVTEVSSDDNTLQNNNYTALNLNLFTTYNLSDEDKIFFGIGQASRVPDARELYFKQNTPVGTVKTTGTDDLEQITNRELDFGYEASYEKFSFKVKGFYSMLSDYIYYQKNLNNNNFVNLDATVYGTELTGTYYATDATTLDMGVSYKRGFKNDEEDGQSRNLADMAPLRANISMNYEYANESTATLELQASDKWDRIDKINGEQEIDAWSVVNMKMKHQVEKGFMLTVGVNNLLDTTYATSN
ncbi:MAG: TonB-dependent receptor, partial [Campylobacterota bacterium]|nr:TonB-dependent receptor [Campylobacterota bacterium]